MATNIAIDPNWFASLHLSALQNSQSSAFISLHICSLSAWFPEHARIKIVSAFDDYMKKSDMFSVKLSIMKVESGNYLHSLLYCTFTHSSGQSISEITSDAINGSAHVSWSKLVQFQHFMAFAKILLEFWISKPQSWTNFELWKKSFAFFYIPCCIEIDQKIRKTVNTSSRPLAIFILHFFWIFFSRYWDNYVFLIL